MNKMYQNIQDTLSAGSFLALETVIQGKEGNAKEGLRRSVKKAVPLQDKNGRLSYQVEVTEHADEITIREPFTSPERLIIFGGGHISLTITAMTT